MVEYKERERNMDVMDRIRAGSAGVDGSQKGATASQERAIANDLPIDGDLYATSAYLGMLNGMNPEFYRRYLDHMKYFTSLFRFEGHDEIEKLNPDIFRQLIEFGKVSITSILDRPVVMSVVEFEKDMFKDIKLITGMPTRVGYGYAQDMKVFKLNKKKTVVIQENFQALPFIFFWKDIIETFIKLKKSAVTGSIASIKKFKRNIQNNDSIITKVETESMVNPDTPYVDNIVSPVSYLTEMTKAIAGEEGKDDKAYSTMPNALEFQSMGTDVKGLWENVKSFLEVEYFQRGRRINTNKKVARNVAGEIDTETINFDILETEYYSRLTQAAKELSEIFGTTIKVVSTVEDVQTDIEGDPDVKQI